MDPSGPSQPSLNEAYAHPSNPAQGASEHASSKSNAASTQRSAPTYDTRTPHDQPDPQQEDAMPTQLAYGVRDDRYDAGDSISPGEPTTEAEQMRAPGEGEIAQAQEGKHGFGEQGSLTSGLDRKKAEQQNIKAERGHGGGGGGGVDVGAAVGGSGFVGAENEGGTAGGGMQADHSHV